MSGLYELPTMSLLITNHLMTSPIYALWVVPSLKVMQSGMAIFDLPENFATPKDIGSGPRMCLADVEIDCAISKYMMLFMLRCLHMITIMISTKHFAKCGALLQILCLLLPGKCPSRCGICLLPMTGCLYDEVVPSALELTGIDEKRFIPHSSKYSFYAYHLLQSADDNRCSHVSIDKWVKFWSKKTTKYHPPPPCKEKKTVRPKSTHNPLSDIAIHERWSTAEEALFAKLWIERSLKEEVYLAAYLACWLCTFVLPDKDVNSIHPSTFKMASLMANARRVNLAIPVLASIYEGLNTIATSPKPVESFGPKMMRFSGEGGAKYYEPREAHKQIHKAEFVSWACNMLVKDGSFKFVDGHAEELDHNYFVAIRSSYLTLRQGGKFIIERYRTHRFGRQFGYFQDVPGTLKYDTRVASLEEGLRYWRLCILSKSSSKAWFSCLPTNAKKLCSEAYKAWWAKVHGTFFDDNIAFLIRSKSIKITLKHKKNEDKQVDGGENNSPQALVPPIVIECDSQAAVAEASKGKDSSDNVADNDSSNKDRHWKKAKEGTYAFESNID
ncbi:UNVERIFIED_CONTAM: hypothetical protein Sradi_4534700 [Sesamum radiatum]|uniref:Aminotransferase-like plant mobile domain-containing protein n=1 Tax=Sesamum radiatum TaxID=300843 RepID=A0AAW2NBD0_SESRA